MSSGNNPLQESMLTKFSHLQKMKLLSCASVNSYMNSVHRHAKLLHVCNCIRPHIIMGQFKLTGPYTAQFIMKYLFVCVSLVAIFFASHTGTTFDSKMLFVFVTWLIHTQRVGLSYFRIGLHLITFISPFHHDNMPGEQTSLENATWKILWIMT